MTVGNCPSRGFSLYIFLRTLLKKPFPKPWLISANSIFNPFFSKSSTKAMEKLLSFLKPIPFAVLMLSVWTSSAQDMRFGKYNAADIAMTNCEFESDAGAVVLGEIGRSYF